RSLASDVWRCGFSVPITGFSNSVVSAAMEYRREGFILGLGGKIFSVAGPVLVFGILAGFVVGLVKALAGGYLF
ncbi:MAG: SpoVA/SpoVAEb family sporulation membrane protein, partial [Limnochordia bacterium]|nr:SpoVA/SpoVAEb family sporulation membrane protein [Limnochordia bacterium]